MAVPFQGGDNAEKGTITQGLDAIMPFRALFRDLGSFNDSFKAMTSGDSSQAMAAFDPPGNKFEVT